MCSWLRFVVLVLAVALALPASAADKKKKQLEDELSLDPPLDRKKRKQMAQVLDVPKEPPAAVVAETQQLVFFNSELSAKGLLSRQVEDGLRSLFQQAKGASILKIRAFVAGSGDMRRVQAIVSETFEEKRLPIPAVSTIQVGALPLEGAQVLLEATAADRRGPNEAGVAWFAGHPAEKGAEPAALLAAASKYGVDPARMLRVTCFLNRVNDAANVRQRMLEAFPKAEFVLVQLQRIPAELFEECEAVGALSKAPAEPLILEDAVPNAYSRVALTAPGKVALTGLQMAFRNDDEDVRRMFGRTEKALESVGAKLKGAALTNYYPLTRTLGERVRRLRFEHYSSERPPATTLLLFEGLPSLDAVLGVEAVAVIP
jgi:enamine deaminase RidA (YjgF/YER057c/UK114 family)